MWACRLRGRTVCRMPEALAPEASQVQGLRVLRWKGQGGGVPLVLLHGMGDGADVWRATVAALRDWHAGDILAPDLPGHWGSAWQGDGHYRLGAMAAQISAALNLLTAGPVRLIGHSLGGRIGACIAVSGAMALQDLVLVDMAPEAGDTGLAAVHAHIDALNHPPFDADRLAAIAAARLALADRAAIDAYLRGAVTALPPAARHAVDPAVMELDASLDGIAADPWDLLARIPCPVTVLRGALSGVVPGPVAHRTALQVRQCQSFAVIAGAGHAVPLEQPRALSEVLRRLAPAARPEAAA